MHYITITCNAKIGALYITCITWENVMHYRALQLQISITHAFAAYYVENKLWDDDEVRFVLDQHS